jgi:transcriptional regulator with XRE-family HTH domain
LNAGRKIRDARIASGISRRTLAGYLGIRAETLDSYERGDEEPPYEICKAVSQIIPVDFIELILPARESVGDSLYSLMYDSCRFLLDPDVTMERKTRFTKELNDAYWAWTVEKQNA